MVADVLTGSLLGNLDIEDPGHDDFELWSPSEERAERCLFGRQVNQSLHVLRNLTADFFRPCIIAVGATVIVS